MCEPFERCDIPSNASAGREQGIANSASITICVSSRGKNCRWLRAANLPIFQGVNDPPLTMIHCHAEIDSFGCVKAEDMRKLILLCVILSMGCTKYAVRDSDDEEEKVYPPPKSEIRELEDRLGV